MHNAAIVRGNVVCPSNFSGLVASITTFDTVPILTIYNELSMTIKALNAQSGKKILLAFTFCPKAALGQTSQR